jgi:hypothetical protein
MPVFRELIDILHRTTQDVPPELQALSSPPVVAGGGWAVAVDVVSTLGYLVCAQRLAYR